jgi:hypothetical protein
MALATAMADKKYKDAKVLVHALAVRIPEDCR